MDRTRYDETWHRLRDWTKGQTPSERLAAQILIHERFQNVDPSHPLGGKDGGKDALAERDGKQFAMAVYFPRGQHPLAEIKAKFRGDVTAAKKTGAAGIVFVTNQELILSVREQLEKLASPLLAIFFHLERITSILDTPQMASVRYQFLDISEDDKPNVSLGGQGGQAPGSGGGGGGALGSNAKGGDGGRGGDTILVKGLSGKAPGAGGGGDGAVGDDATGGQGGGGGDQLVVTLDADDLARIYHFDFRVGKGGKDGGPGEDTIVNACDEEGRVIESFVAKGGEPGAAPSVAARGRVPTDEDIASGLCVTCVIVSEYFRLKGGFVTIIDGGWDWVKYETNPFQVTLPIVAELETGSIEPGTNLSIDLIMHGPDGFEVYRSNQTLHVPSGAIRRTRFGAVIECTGSIAGVWCVQIMAGKTRLREFPIEIRAPEAATSGPSQN